MPDLRNISIKYISAVFALVGCTAMSGIAQDASNCELIYHWSNDTIPATTAHGNVYNEIWGYEAEGREYAIIGTTSGTHIFDITDEGQEAEVAFVEGAVVGTQMVHRDFHTYTGYLYAVADEGPSTLQIIDLHNLPVSVDVVYDSSELIQRAHNIFIDEEALEDPKEFYTTLIHELGHAVFHEGSILQAGIPKEVEEILVDQISKVVYSEVLVPILKEIPPPIPKDDTIEVCEES